MNRKRGLSIISVANDYFKECFENGHTARESRDLAAEYFLLLDFSTSENLEMEKDFEIVGLYLKQGVSSHGDHVRSA